MARTITKWKIAADNNIDKKLTPKKILDILLVNRGLKTSKQKDEFVKPTKPENISLSELSMSKFQIEKTIARIKRAKKLKEKVVVYGDYDADGVCATAILWETLYMLKINVLPYIPERFSEGYGLNKESVEKLNKNDSKVKLIITVDNGIVANEAVDYANSIGIDIIITDHHEKGKILPKALSIIHTTKTSGAGVAWFFSNQLKKSFRFPDNKGNGNGLDLAAIGTISDQIPLLGVNRSLVKSGLEMLRKTKRKGLIKLFEEASIVKESITTYEVGFVIAPRINATGRLEHAIDSLRLLCTTSFDKAQQLAIHLGKINKERQLIVEEVIAHARELVRSQTLGNSIVIADENYHEGVIGLAASKLVEEFYRPAIVISKGAKVSKASARSISGFNIIKTIRKLEIFHLGGGGHPMAAGFSIKTKNIKRFREEFEKEASSLIGKELLIRRIKVDMKIDFNYLNWELAELLKLVNPVGIGNPTPTFVTTDIKILESKTVGSSSKHLKLKLQKGGIVFDAIAFGMGDMSVKLTDGSKIDCVYSLEENTWNGHTTLQLKIRDMKII
jgi:single-stranded-DNA-specific exonuclease